MANWHQPFTSRRKIVGRKSFEERLQNVHSNWFGFIMHNIKNEKERKKERKKEVVHNLMTALIHLHCSMPTNAPTSVNTYILNLGIWNMLIDINFLDLRIVFDVLFIGDVTFGRWLCECDANKWIIQLSSSIKWSAKNEQILTHTQLHCY